MIQFPRRPLASHTHYDRLRAALTAVVQVLDRPALFSPDGYPQNAIDLAAGVNAARLAIEAAGLTGMLAGGRVEDNATHEELQAVELLLWCAREGGYQEGEPCPWLDAWRNTCASMAGGEGMYRRAAECVGILVDQLLTAVKPDGEPAAAMVLIGSDGFRCPAGEVRDLSQLQFMLAALLIRDGEWVRVPTPEVLARLYERDPPGDPLNSLKSLLKRLNRHCRPTCAVHFRRRGGHVEVRDLTRLGRGSEVGRTRA